MTLTIEQARAQLIAAEEQAAEERRRQLLGQLDQARKDLRRMRSRHQALATRIQQQRSERHEGLRQLRILDQQLADSWSARPRVADYLPDDEDVIAWEEQHHAIEEKRAALLAALPNPDQGADFDEACSYEGATGKIATLEFTVENLLRQLDGQGRHELKGGIYGVR
jgi:hypothetical protein